MPKRKKLTILVIVLVVAVLAGVVWKRSHDLAAMAKPAIRAIPVQVAVANPGTVAVTSHYLGKLDSAIVAELSARITANIVAVQKREGDKVTAGEVLLLLDDITLANKTRAVEAELRAARSALAAAESFHQSQQASFERNQRLYAQSAIALEAYENSRAAADSAASQMVAAQERIRVLEENKQASLTEQAYTRITAPFEGVVTKRMAEPGEMALPGKTLLALQAVGQGYKITVQVPQDTTSLVHAGTEAILSHGSQQLSGAVDKVYPALTTASLATVEIQVPTVPFQLPLGAMVGVDIVLDRVNGLIVPVQALINNNNGSFVVTVDAGNSARPIPVKVVGKNAEEAAVTGIDAGSQVVVGQENQLMQLTPGKKVVIIQNRGDGI